MKLIKPIEKNLFLLLLLLITLMLTFTYTEVASAAEIKTTDDGNFQYYRGTYQDESGNGNNEIFISKYSGSDENVVIPETIEGLPVKVIYRFAFKNSAVKTVSGNSVAKVMGMSFENCKNLVSVNFPNLEIVGAMESNRIYYGPFYNCSALTELKFPSVVNIDPYSFGGCDSLKTIEVPNLQILNTNAFADSTDDNGVVKSLKSIESIRIPCTLYNANKDYIKKGKYTGYSDTFHPEYIVEPIHQGTWTVETEATSTSTGKKNRLCPVCNNPDTADIPVDENAHKFTNYVYNNNAKVGVDGTETASCDYGCGKTDTRTKAGTALKNTASSGGGGGGFILPSAPIQKPTVSAGSGYTTALGKDGSTLEITLESSYKLDDVLVNGISKGASLSLTGLKDGDKVEIKVSKEEVSNTEQIKAQLAELTKDNFKARSAQIKLKSGKKAIKITWTNTNGIKFDGVEIFRSSKKNSGYGKKPCYSSKSDKYYNTAIKQGSRYYYKVRGYVEIDGVKYYSAWSAKAWRTVK